MKIYEVSKGVILAPVRKDPHKKAEILDRLSEGTIISGKQKEGYVRIDHIRSEVQEENVDMEGLWIFDGWLKEVTNE